MNFNRSGSEVISMGGNLAGAGEQWRSGVWMKGVTQAVGNLFPVEFFTIG